MENTQPDQSITSIYPPFYPKSPFLKPDDKILIRKCIKIFSLHRFTILSFNRIAEEAKIPRAAAMNSLHRLIRNGFLIVETNPRHPCECCLRINYSCEQNALSLDEMIAPRINEIQGCLSKGEYELVQKWEPGNKMPLPDVNVVWQEIIDRLEYSERDYWVYRIEQDIIPVTVRWNILFVMIETKEGYDYYRYRKYRELYSALRSTDFRDRVKYIDFGVRRVPVGMVITKKKDGQGRRELYAERTPGERPICLFCGTDNPHTSADVNHPEYEDYLNANNGNEYIEAILQSEQKRRPALDILDADIVPDLMYRDFIELPVW